MSVIPNFDGLYAFDDVCCAELLHVSIHVLVVLSEVHFRACERRRSELERRCLFARVRQL